MRKFFSGLWRVITYPFRLIFNIITFPFQALYRRSPTFFDGAWKVVSYPFWAIKQFNDFLNTEPKESDLLGTVTSVIESAEVREQMWNHIEAFRMHLLRALLALILTVCASFFFTQRIVEFLALPIGGLAAMKAIDPTESIGVFMKVAIFSGVALSIPYIAFEMWWFAAPGLRPYERKMGLAGIPLASIFFIGGAAFTFFIMLPAAMPFLTSFLGIKTELRPQSYFSFVTGLMFWIGISFEFPLVIYVLSAIGFVQPKVLTEQWRLAIVIISIIAAMVTPTIDFFNQGLVMAPLIALYFLSIGLSHIAYAGRKRKQAEAQKKAEEAETG
jgi:sec-independent protein translocase protein TatC